MIQLKLRPIIIENSQTQITEEFKCLIMRPLYVEGSFKRSDGSDCYKLLKSNYRDSLAGVVCIITTLQEGYLFQFCNNGEIYLFLYFIRKVIISLCFRN